MLTPEQLATASRMLQPLFEEYEDFVLRDFARRLTDAGGWTGTAEWQAKEGVATGVSINAIVSEMKRTLAISDDDLVTLFTKAGLLNILQENERLTTAGLNAVKISTMPQLEQIVKEIVVKTMGTFHNFSGSLGVVYDTVTGRRSQNLTAYFQSAIDLAMLKTRTGVCNYNSAIKTAVKGLAKEGVSVIDYASGRYCHLDVAVRRATLTGLNQMASLQNREITNALGLPLAEVTAHQGARPTHAQWQGKVYQIEGSSKKYKNLAMATGLGTATGLLGVNCRYQWYGFAEGMHRAWTDEMLKDIDPPDFEYRGKNYTAYQATQRQRQLERMMRAKKREIVGYDALGDVAKNEFDTASLELKELRKEYKSFSDAADLRVKNERAQVKDFDRAMSSRTTWGAKRKAEDLRRKEKVATFSNGPFHFDERGNTKAYEAKIKKARTEIEQYHQVTGLHCDGKVFQQLDVKGNVVKKFTPGELAKIIKSDYLFQNKPVKIYSCNAGAPNATAAQNLANALGVDVKAPVDYIALYSDGQFHVVSLDNNGKVLKKYKVDEQWKIFNHRKKKK
ncbi:MAG: minor capsid protein [Eubacteriaceae bacterium]|nr:minor capsid protein [Eubacteriaceae bacterium]